MERSLILLELNELCPSLMERFLAGGELPAFARLRREAEVYVTDAGEEPPALEPWIQWVTVHSGLSFAEHGVFHLGEGQKLGRPSVWDLASRAGMTVWVCGSMNGSYERPLHGAFLPDPWTTGVGPHPAELGPYFRFVQRNVQEYTRDQVPLAARDYASFLAFMGTHGLTARTVGAIARQLLSERTGRTRWRRAAILDRLQFDVFRCYYRRLRPGFSTFFLNSTAHFQHMYWRHMEPERFAVKPTAEESAAYERAILFGYRSMDRLVARFLDLAGPGTTLVLATALSQQPCLKYEALGGKSFYRPRDFDRLLRFAGVEGSFTVSPVMSEEFHVFFAGEEEARAAADRLGALAVGGRPAVKVERTGASLFSGCSVFERLDTEARLVAAGGREARFEDLFYLVDGTKSGMHHPDGILWIRHPDRRHAVHPGKVPLTDVAPTLRDLLGLEQPDFMGGRPLGRTSPAPVASVAEGR